MINRCQQGKHTALVCLATVPSRNPTEIYFKQQHFTIITLLAHAESCIKLAVVSEKIN